MQTTTTQQHTAERFILNTAQYYKGEKTIDLLTSCLLLDAFQREGYFNLAGEEIEINELKNNLLNSERHQRLFYALLDILERNDYIKITDNIIRATSKVTDNSTKMNIRFYKETSKENLTNDQIINNHLWPIATFTREILETIFRVLSEEKTYLEVLFPNNDFSRIENIYKGNVQTFQNLKLAEAVRDKVEQRLTLHPGKKIKLLEVGAGTGMGTFKVLEYLKPYSDHIEFWFTDISSGFARRAKKKFFKDYPFMKFGALDIGKPVEDQGYNHHEMDIVFCTNVVHATPSIMVVFNNLMDLLKSDGQLFINDLSKRLDWVTIIFGLTEGWWYYQDGELRIPHSPILSLDKFEQLFEESGFENIQSIGLDIIPREHFPQSIITGTLKR